MPNLCIRVAVAVAVVVVVAARRLNLQGPRSKSLPKSMPGRLPTVVDTGGKGIY